MWRVLHLQAFTLVISNVGFKYISMYKAVAYWLTAGQFMPIVNRQLMKICGVVLAEKAVLTGHWWCGRKWVENEGLAMFMAVLCNVLNSKCQ